jgi:hypothetical protein
MKLEKLKTSVIGYKRLLAALESELWTDLFPVKNPTHAFLIPTAKQVDDVRRIAEHVCKDVEKITRAKNQNGIMFTVESVHTKAENSVTIKDAVRGTVVAKIYEI